MSLKPEKQRLQRLERKAENVEKKSGSKMLMRATPGTLRDALRQETSQLHDALEQRVEHAGYFDTLEGYQRWLVKMQKLHSLFAHDYDAGAVAMGLNPISARLQDALDADTGGSHGGFKKACLPSNTAFGVAYVFEGSAVGARILRRRVALLGAAPDCYLTTLVDASLTRWPRVKDSCEKIETSPDAAGHPAVLGARTVFEAFLKAFGAPSR